MMSNTTEKHTENVYAYDENFNEIFILDVPYEERGERKPYFCLGCKRQMQAVYRKKEKERHFRHVVVKLPGEKKCTYRDETYRHKLAKEIIQGLKRIKVPRVYKYHPDRKQNEAVLIRESDYINGASVEIEKFIYENELGEIEVSSQQHTSTDKFLLIKPDAILMDSKNRPILLIEFVATFKPDFEKLAKIKRLGIDCIQVNIPKSSPEEIEQTFHITTRTKWLYNDEEERTDYFLLPKSHSGGISEIDLEQRKLLEEGFRCRKARIGSLIRRIEIILRDEQYQSVANTFKSEIQRVESNTKREKAELDVLRELHFAKGIKKHQERRKSLESSQKEFQNYTSDLENRYSERRKKIKGDSDRIEEKIRGINHKIYASEFGDGNLGTSIIERRRSIEETQEEEKRLDRAYRDEQDEFNESRKEIELKFEQEEKNIQQLIEQSPAKFEKEKSETRRRNIQSIQRLNEELGSFTSKEREIKSKFKNLRRETRQTFEKLRSQIDHSIKTRNYQTEGGIANEYRRLYKFELAIEEYNSALKQLKSIEERIETKSRESRN